jgi:GNAT superfamily N-acetyltransferase
MIGTLAPPTVLRPLSQSAAGDLAAAMELLAAALPLDRVDVVAGEKLFSGNARRSGRTLGAFSPGGELLGVLARAGRWIKLLAVRPQARRKGLGTQLLQAARDEWRSEHAEAGPTPKLRIGDHPGNYLSPGLDERYEEGRAFLRARGFTEVGTNLNLRTDLDGNPCVLDAHLQPLEEKARAAGYTIRRATAADVAPLSEMVSRVFSPTWTHEVQRALGPALGGAAAAHTPQLPEGAAVHVALDVEGRPAAFAAHDGNNRGLGWFGPMGTLDAHRGKGLGEVLLLRCLRDVAEHRRPEGGVIAWVGPVKFYAQACGARPERRFVVYEES